MSDVLIQTQNKSYVPRIIEYYEKFVFCGRESQKPFPRYAEREDDESELNPPSTSTSSSSLHGRLGTSTVELSRGCRGGRGPGLVLVRGVLATPEELIEWIRWRSPLPRAVARVYWFGKERRRKEKPSSLGSSGDEKEKKEEASNGDQKSSPASPPASAEDEREGEAEVEDGDGTTFATFSASTSAELARRILSRCSPPPPRETPVRVMAVPKSLQISLVDALADAGWPLDPRGSCGRGGRGKGPLSLVAAALDGLDEFSESERTRHDPPLPDPRYRAALVRSSAVLADTTEQRQVGKRACRAEWKLSEALAGLLPLLPEEEEEELVPPGLNGNGGRDERSGRGATAMRALDVGASPGGWTRHLALSLKATRVVALDPAALDEDVASLPNVTHLRLLSHSPGALEAARAALCCAGGVEGEGEEGRGERQQPLATLLTCDANDIPAAAARCIVPLIPLLAPGALVVLTLKLRHPGKDKAFATKAAVDELEPAGLELLDSRWLMANTMFERTLLLRKR